MKELSEELRELKKSPRFMDGPTSCSEQGKLAKLKAELKFFKEQFEAQEIHHKEKVKKLLNAHKEQLGDYLNIISVQKEELSNSNKLISTYKHESNSLRVSLRRNS
eukprot:TRINITY_DN16138_c0_g1_i1.p4 TRINITY_DN16138_c0_g1~~TRINITY_DN16138_c0_g1_i1.p4  ORF type:complete len:106 (+),score=25.26 TRINITY_DN16138_c0_g1_i1:339-656(+)